MDESFSPEPFFFCFFFSSAFFSSAFFFFSFFSLFRFITLQSVHPLDISIWGDARIAKMGVRD